MSNIQNTDNLDQNTNKKHNNIKLAKILIKAKKAVYSDMAGNTITTMKGDGYDFSEIREYIIGDDIKKIDWNTTAKTNKLHIKIFHPSKELNVNIVSLLGGSVFFGSKKLKQDVIAEVCAILAFSSCATSDSYSSFICGNELILSTAKTKKLIGVNFVTQNILNFNALSQTIDYTTLGTRLHNTLAKKSILFLIGDFVFANKLNLQILSKKHDIILIIIRDKLEEELIDFSTTSLRDPSFNTTIDSISNSKIMQKHKNKIKKSDLEFLIYLKKLGVSFVKIYTHDNPISKIKKLFI